MTKLLVVGGTGFIGYHIIKEAKKRKWNVTSVSLNKPKIKRFHKNVIYKKANISDLNKLKKDIDPTNEIKKEVNSIKDTANVFEKEIEDIKNIEKENSKK